MNIERDFDIWYCDTSHCKFDPKTFIHPKEYFPICPICGEETEFTYVDPSGGLHGGGVGINPYGENCGECNRMDCTFCNVWLDKIKEKKNGK